MTDSGSRTARVEPPTVKVADLTGPNTWSGSFGVDGTDLGDTFDDACVGGRLPVPGARRRTARPLGLARVDGPLAANRPRTTPRCGPADGCTAGTLSQPYGGHIVPGSTLSRLSLVVSSWNTTDGSNWPYRAMQYRHDTTARL